MKIEFLKTGLTLNRAESIEYINILKLAVKCNNLLELALIKKIIEPKFFKLDFEDEYYYVMFNNTTIFQINCETT